MDSGKYYKDGAARVLDLLKDTFGNYFKAYFDGEAIPTESLLPCVMVTVTKSSVASDATGTDRIQETIVVMIVENRKEDIGAPANANLTEFRLRKKVMGQDPTTQQYIPESIMYALRKHYTLNNGFVVDNNVDIDFSPNIRGTIDSPINTMEAYVTLNLARLALVPSRD